MDELGLAEKTLFVFLSDNGPWLRKGTHGGLATPLREGKGTTWEGGHRVPAIMRWPGKIPANVTNEAMTTIMDLYPTIAGVVGADLPEDRVIDGKDIWPILSGQKGAKSPHDAFYYYYMTQLHAVRAGKWKLHLSLEQKLVRPGRRRPSKVALYDLENDPHERQNLAAQSAHKPVVDELRQRLLNLLFTADDVDLIAPRWVIPQYVCTEVAGRRGSEGEKEKEGADTLPSKKEGADTLPSKRRRSRRK